MASSKLAEFCWDLVDPTAQKHLVIIGDSINSPEYHYQQNGLRELPFLYNGYMSSACSTGDWGSSSPQTTGSASVNQPVSPLGATYGGAFAATNLTTAGGWPMMIRELTYSSNPTNIMECACNSIYFDTNAFGFGGMPRRDKWLFQNGEAVTARFMFLADPRNFGGFTVVGKRGVGGTGSGTADVVYAKSLTDGSIVSIDVPCGTSTGVTSSNRPYTFVKASSGFSAGSADTFGFLGCRFMNNDAAGVLISWTAFASWTTGDHAYASSYTEANLTKTIVAQGYTPTHIWVELNENINSGVRAGQAELLGSGSYAEFNSNLGLIVAKWEAAIAAAAVILGVPYVAPKWLFSSSHKTSTKTLTFRQTLQSGLGVLAASNSRYSFLDKWQEIGGDNWDYNQYTGDGIHPNAEGGRQIMRRVAHAIRRDLGIRSAPRGGGSFALSL